MINELIEKIKGPKKLSFNHWRYKTLHWAFGINPKAPIFSPLPNSFYTHYCPLFHLTNLIVIFSPFIIMFKLAKAFLKGTLICFDTIRFLLFKLFKRKEKVEKLLTKEEALAIKRESAFDQIREYVETGISRDGALEIFRIRNYKDFISDEEFFTCYDKHVEKLKKLREKELKKAEKDIIFKQRLYFWVNFSSSCGKFLINLAYVGLGLVSIYMLYNVACFFLTIPFAAFISALVFLMEVALLILSSAFFVGVLWKIFSWLDELIRSYKDDDKHKDSTFAVPLSLISSWLKAFFKYVDKKCDSFVEFCSVYYENNCPAIVLEEEENEDKKDDNDNS